MIIIKLVIRDSWWVSPTWVDKVIKNQIHCTLEIFIMSIEYWLLSYNMVESNIITTAIFRPDWTNLSKYQRPKDWEKIYKYILRLCHIVVQSNRPCCRYKISKLVKFQPYIKAQQASPCRFNWYSSIQYLRYI